MLGTIRAVEQDLLRDGLVLRYRTQSGVDGLPGDEHPFLACSFWLVTAYARAGMSQEATTLMDRLVGLANDLGLLSEEYDPVGGTMVGNYPAGVLAPGSRRRGSGRRRGERGPGDGPAHGGRSDMRWSDVTAEHIAAETERVVATAASLRNDAVLAPSLCAGWSRGHVLSHVARNADALARVCAVALTGEPGTMYASQQARDDEIEAGRPASRGGPGRRHPRVRRAPRPAARRAGPRARRRQRRARAGGAHPLGRPRALHAPARARLPPRRPRRVLHVRPGRARARRPLPRRGGRAPAHRRRGAVGAARHDRRGARCSSSAAVPPS